MKKILTILAIFALALIMSIGAFAAENDAPKVVQPGDVNADGDINIKDVVLLAQYLAGWEVQLGGDSHTVVIDEAVEPTCKTTGLTEGKHCSDCGMILVKQQVIPTTDHDYEETFVNPTTTSDGYTLCICNDCGHEVKKDFIPALDSNGLDVEVDVDKKTCVITGIGTCTDTVVNIPEKISDYIVVGIADKAFSEQTQITKVTLPKYIKTLGQRAFYGCTGLTEFTIPESVTSIGHQIFHKCDNLETVYYNSSFSPDEDMIFLNYSSIKNIVFGGETIPAFICFKSSNIQKIKILDTVKSLNEYAFYGCTNLNEVTIGNSVTNIGQHSFQQCSNLKTVTIGNCVKSIEYAAFRDCVKLSNVSIGNGVTTIGYGAFYNCSSLEQIAIPDSVIKIVDWAFGYCEGLKNVTISDSVTNIGSNAFYHCSNLVNVEIPNSTVTIGSDAFSWCRSLESVTFGISVSTIGDSAFRYCSNLTSVYYVGDSYGWSNITIGFENPELKSATKYYYSDTSPITSGNYWHYVDGKPTPW